jgi:uncharacterized membrane protein
MSGDPPRPARFEERNVPPTLQGLVSRVLRSGVSLAAALLSIGVVWEGAAGRGLLLTTTAPTTGPGFARLYDLGGPGIVALAGVLVLVVTPLARVTISAGLFAAAKDRPFTAITLFVLAVLATTIVVGALR